MLRRILLILITLPIWGITYAQQGLNVNALFDGKVVTKAQTLEAKVVEVKVKGRALSKYNLNFYRSYSFQATPEQKAKVDELVERDRQNAVSSETTRRGRNTTMILTMIPDGANNRFVCYITKHNDKQINLTVVYMEGRVKNISELRKLIK